MFNESKTIQIKSSFDFICFYRKKGFDKIIDVLKSRKPPTMYELGLEFLRVYDGKFNYREGDKVCDSFFIY
jgi:hypothetical protein